VVADFTEIITDALEIDSADMNVAYVFEEEPGVTIEFQIFAPYDDEDPVRTLHYLGQEFKDTAYALKDFFRVPVMQI